MVDADTAGRKTILVGCFGRGLEEGFLLHIYRIFGVLFDMSPNLFQPLKGQSGLIGSKPNFPYFIIHKFPNVAITNCYILPGKPMINRQ